MDKTRIGTAPAVIGLALTASIVSGGFASASAGASAPHQARGSVTLTNRDNGRRITVERGQRITVRLTGARGRGTTEAWSVPSADAPAVLVRLEHHTSPGGGAVAVFRAARRGKSDLTAFRRCVARRGRVCPRVILRWRVAVEVR